MIINLKIKNQPGSLLERDLARACGYIQIYDKISNKTSYIRRTGQSPYPRFHLYLTDDKNGDLILNLHLDQKKPSYGRYNAHSGEYDGGTVEQEAQRIKNILLRD